MCWGRAIIVQLEDYLASSGFNGIGIITGAIFVLVVTLFRRGVWGTAMHLLRARTGRGEPDPEPAVEPRDQQPDVQPARR